ncbi:MAG: DHHA1 domain-containing protein, partial [Acidobacteriota bacterium]
EIEDRVNEEIVRNQAVDTEILPLDKALASGAVALFGERYGEKVRVVSVPGFSTELCGGLHCSATGDIGVFKIISEKGISAGVRRMEALTGTAALGRFRTDEEQLSGLAADLGVPREEMERSLHRLLQRQKEILRERDRLRLHLAGQASDDQVVEDVDGLRLLVRRVRDLDRSQMRHLADQLKHEADVVVLGTVRDDRVALLVAVGDDAARRVSAREIVGRIARTCGGGGGGRPTLAEAGGRRPENLDQALAGSEAAVREILAAAGAP